MAELADAPDLGSGGRPCRFKSCYPHKIRVLRHFKCFKTLIFLLYRKFRVFKVLKNMFT